MNMIGLNKENLEKHLNNDQGKIHVRTFEETTSTNDDAKQLLFDKPEKTFLVAANKQTAGRGRHGKTFYSALEHGLYFSLAFTPQGLDYNEFPLYTLLAAAALAEVLERHVSGPVSIKWVNDIFYQGRKVSGILSEAGVNAKAGNIPYVIIGVGINFSGGFNAADHGTQRVAGTLFGKKTPANFDQNKFLAEFVNQFMNYHLAFEDKQFLSVYSDHLLGIGKEVIYKINGEEKSGRIKGINDKGHLIVLKEDQTEEAIFSQAIEFGSRQFTDFKG